MSDTDQNKSGDRQRVGPLKRLLRQIGLMRNGDHSLRESLEEVIDEHQVMANEQPLGAEERSMLKNILNAAELRLDDVMVPRADITAVDEGVGFAALVTAFVGAAHSRLPVYVGTLDEVIGMVHVKDALMCLASGDVEGAEVRDLVRPVLFVAPSMKLFDLLESMRHRRTHMAIVVDEFGGTDGLVTIEDLVEEIVGDIEDEHDEKDEPELIINATGSYEADARLPIEDLEDVLECDLLPDARDDDVDTLGGLVVALADQLPGVGDFIAHDLGYRFEVVEADERRIKKVRIHLPDAPEVES